MVKAVVKGLELVDLVLELPLAGVLLVRLQYHAFKCALFCLALGDKRTDVLGANFRQ